MFVSPRGEASTKRMNANDDRNKTSIKRTGKIAFRVDQCDLELVCLTKWKFKLFSLLPFALTLRSLLAC